MHYHVATPEFMDGAGVVRVEAIYPAPGELVKAGARLFDVSVDLGSSFQQNCPPISYFRIVAREAGRVCDIPAVLGETRDTGALLAKLEPLDASAGDEPESRPLRVTVAGILWHEGLWSADNH